MASSNIKLFDENKGNMLNDTEFNISTQRINGLQTGVASSQLQNKAMYQASLVAYAIAQLMLANGQNANDTDAVSTFVNNLLASIVQKKLDKATADDVLRQVAGKWVDAKQLGELKADIVDNYLPLLGGTMLGDLFLNADPTSALQAVTKQYVDDNDVLISVGTYTGNGTYGILGEVTIVFPFLPTVIFMPNQVGAYYAQPAVFFDDLPEEYGTAVAYDADTKEKVLIKKSISNKSISFYFNDTSGFHPFNRIGKVYKWMAIYKKFLTE